MLQARLVVVQVMDQWHVSGAILEDQPDQGWTSLATFSQDVPISDAWLSEDPTATVIHVIRQWAEMTIRS